MCTLSYISLSVSMHLVKVCEWHECIDGVLRGLIGMKYVETFMIEM